MAQEASEVADVGNGGDGGGVTRDTVVIAAILVLLLLLIAAAVAYVRRKQGLSEAREDDREEAREVKEWLYQDGGEVKGPFTNSQMRQYWVAGLLNRATKAKVVWWSSDFAPLSALFPQTGSEFAVPAKTEETEAHNTGWHRYSVLAQPTDAIAAALTWFYQLPNGKEEGPFETGKMRHWFVTGFFDESTLVRFEGSGESSFTPLKELFPSLQKAFDTLPKGCSQETARKSLHARASVRAPAGRASAGGFAGDADRISSLNVETGRSSRFQGPGQTIGKEIG